MSGPARYDPPPIYRGCDWGPITLIWKNQDGTITDLTGWTPFAETIAGDTLNPVVTDPANGTTTLALPRTLTGGLKLGAFTWDWVWYDDAAKLRYPPTLKGIIQVQQPATHDFA